MAEPVAICFSVGPFPENCYWLSLAQDFVFLCFFEFSIKTLCFVLVFLFFFWRTGLGQTNSKAHGYWSGHALWTICCLSGLPRARKEEKTGSKTEKHEVVVEK